MAKTLFDKIWDSHVIKDLGNGFVLLHIDRLLLHDLSGARALQEAVEKGYTPAEPRLMFATPDHAISTAPGRSEKTFPPGEPLVRNMRTATAQYGIRMFDLGQDGNGIVHIVGPELALTLPGTTLICGDSHTCTHGGMGALAFGVGSSELVHAPAPQTMVQRKPKRLRVHFEGAIPAGVTPKDMILHLIGEVGTAAGTGHAVEYAGSAIRALPVEGRLTICNLSIEMGARTGMVAPQITWGTSPEHVIAVDKAIPDPASGPDDKRAAWTAALQYQGLEPGRPIEGTRVDWVFIGSCTNSRISDLRAAAAIAKGRHKAAHVNAWIVPGSERVKRQAEAEGLDRIFREAGFEWREPGCSMCIASNGERVPPGQRSVSTSNRNFVGRQGPGARTHLASPAMAAAAAIRGAITDVRKL